MTQPVAVRAKSTDRFVVKGWTGEIRDLTKIIDNCRALALQAQSEVKALFEQNEAERRVTYFQDNPHLDAETLEARWRQRQESLLKENYASLDLQMNVKQKKWGREISGPPAEVLREMDTDEVVELTLSIGEIHYTSSSAGYAVQVKFDRTDGVEVRAEAPNHLWVQGVMSSLRSQLVDGRPWYWWMRSIWMAYAVVLIPFAALYAPVGRLLKLDGDDAALSAVVTTGSCVVMGIALVIVLWRGLQRMLPAFELVRAGGKAVGARAIAVVGGSTLWIVGTVALPLLLP